MTDNQNFALDFSEVLHRHSYNLLTIFQSLIPVYGYLGDNPFGTKYHVTQVEIDEILGNEILLFNADAKRIYASLNEPTVEIEGTQKVKRILDEIFFEFENYLSEKSGKRKRPPFIRVIIDRFIADFNKLSMESKEDALIASLFDKAKKIQKIICFYDFNSALLRIQEMEKQTNSLRDFYFDANKNIYESQLVKVDSLINSIIQEYDEYAKNRDIEIKYYNEDIDATVEVDKRRVLRALSNLLNNAIKYNYQLEGTKNAWVDIKVRVQNSQVSITFENWGVPILEDEIISENVFNVGVRGSLTSGIDGNGIGLADAKQIAIKHGGNITIKSIPSRKLEINDKMRYKIPYITEVALYLPASQDQMNRILRKKRDTLHELNEIKKEGDEIVININEIFRWGLTGSFNFIGEQIICEINNTEISNISNWFNFFEVKYFPSELKVIIKDFHFRLGLLKVSMKDAFLKYENSLEYGVEYKAKVVCIIKKKTYWIILDNNCEGILISDSFLNLGDKVQVLLDNKSRNEFRVYL